MSVELPSYHVRLKDRLIGIILHDIALPRLPVTYEGQENLKEIREILLRNQSVVFATNHISHLDLVLETMWIQHVLHGIPHTTGIFASIKFFTGRMPPLIASIAHGLSWRDRYTLHPTVQVNDRQYTHSERSALNQITMQQVNRVLEQKTPPGVIGLSPEGSRSDDGTLQIAQKGVGTLLTHAEYLIPMAAINTNGIFNKKEHLNLREHGTLRAGKPIPSEEIFSEGDKPHDAVMRHIRLLLPKEMWGYYVEQELAAHFQEDIRVRS